MNTDEYLDSDDETDVQSSPLRSGKDEMNFAEFPIALLTDKVPNGQKTIRFEDQIFDEKRKRMITRRRIIEGSEEYGLPTATDDLVVLALIQLTKLKGDFQNRELVFSRFELIKLLGWADEGRSFERIKLSLLRIKSVNYIYDNAWWDSRSKTWTTRAFSIIDNVEINDSRSLSGQVGRNSSRIVWNEVVFDSFQSGFLRDIDFQLCIQLKHPIALRIYRFLGKRFYFKTELIFDLKEFALKHMMLNGNYEGGIQLARKLKPAIDELETAGFLEPLSEKERFLKKGREWLIRFVQKGSNAPAAANTFSDSEALAEAKPSPLEAKLQKRGIAAKIASELVQQHSAVLIQEKIEVFDWLMEKHDRKVGKNPEGYLVESIKNQYKIPKGYVSQAEQDRQEAARQAKVFAEAEARRAEREAEQADQRKRQAIKARWEALSTEQKTEFQKLADSKADPQHLAKEAGAIKRMGQQIRREELLWQIIESENSAVTEP